VTLPKENLPLDGVNFLKISSGILKIRPSRSDFQPGGLIPLPYSICAIKDYLPQRKPLPGFCRIILAASLPFSAVFPFSRTYNGPT